MGKTEELMLTKTDVIKIVDSKVRDVLHKFRPGLENFRQKCVLRESLSSQSQFNCRVEITSGASLPENSLSYRSL